MSENSPSSEYFSDVAGLFNPESLPEHVAIIMDGNGRWAQNRGKQRVEGHKAGADTMRTILKACGQWGIKYLTVYAFSTENWKRPQAEVDALMLLLETYLQSEADELEREGVRLATIGDISKLPRRTRDSLASVKARLNNGTGVTLTLALNYGGRDEIIRAVRSLAGAVLSGELAVVDISEELLAGKLDTAGVPDPDLLIRTAGEMRLSNFMLWQVSYSEFYSTAVCWPDFDRREFALALGEYQKRTRKFGDLAK